MIYLLIGNGGLEVMFMAISNDSYTVNIENWDKGATAPPHYRWNYLSRAVIRTKNGETFVANGYGETPEDAERVAVSEANMSRRPFNG